MRRLDAGDPGRATVRAVAKRHKRRGGRTTPKGTRPRGWSSEPKAPQLVADVGEMLGEPSPFRLMEMASGLIEATTPRPLDDWPGAQVERSDGDSTFLAFARSEWASLEALALAVAVMHPDVGLVERLRSTVRPSTSSSGPPWLARMDAIEITGAWQQTDVLGDGENVLVSWRWPEAAAATALVYVDHNMGTVVKDAFLVPEDGEALLASIAALQPEHGSTVPVDLAVARARVSEAIRAGERTLPPFETDSWPSCRPMLEWVVGHLPAGGVGFERPDWPEVDRQRLLDEFVASPHGVIAGVAPKDVRDLADPLVWFGCDYGPGDPLRWSPVSVEIVLANWYPRKVLGLTEAEVGQVPDVLAGFVRFAHARMSIPPELTDATITAIERWRREFSEASCPGRSSVDNAVELARVLAGDDFDELDDDDWIDDELDDEEFLAQTAAAIELDHIDLVGGRAAYESLTDTPLGDVAFDWSRIPDALLPLTQETLACLDRWAGELYDTEVRTIARGVLAEVIEADPGVFKRSPRTDGLAAAILAYLMRRLTGRMSAEERRRLPWSVFTQKELAAATGVSASSISNRSRTVENVVSRADFEWSAMLHSTQRREVLATRQLIAAWRSENG